MPEHFELKKKEVAVRGLAGAGGRHRGALLSTICVGKCATTVEPWGWQSTTNSALWGTEQCWQCADQKTRNRTVSSNVSGEQSFLRGVRPAVHDQGLEEPCSAALVLSHGIRAALMGQREPPSP